MNHKKHSRIPALFLTLALLLTACGGENTAASRNVFWGNDVTTVILPASIESIGEDAFRGNEGMAVRAPVSLRDTVSSWFYGYSSMENSFEWY